MFRAENFVFGSGSGFSTECQITCEWCGRVHNKGMGLDDEEETRGVTVRSIRFGGLEIAECCFEKLENAVLARAPDIAKWFKDKAGLHLERSKELEDASSKIAEASEVLG
ncbi:MAG: hypothetical protein WCP11_01850 [Candidatus Saccharibacteria bacterium]